MNEISERDGKGRFLTGNGGGGRKPGQRNKLGEAYIADLRECWELNGRSVLERVAKEEPAVLLKIIASLLPRDVNLNLDATDSATSFAANFKTALAMLHGQQQPHVKVIEGKSNVGHPG